MLQNVPAGGDLVPAHAAPFDQVWFAGKSFLACVTSNFLILAILKLLVSSYVIPPTAAWLARIKYGVECHSVHHLHGTEFSVQIFRTQVRSVRRAIFELQQMN